MFALLLKFILWTNYDYLASYSKCMQYLELLSSAKVRFLNGGHKVESYLLFIVLQDKFGRRGILIFLCSALTIPVYGFLAFAPNVHPLVPTIWLGFTYSMAAVS